MTRIYDASALSLFRECPERYRQRYVLNLVRDYDDDVALRGGKAFHAGLDAWFSDDWANAKANNVAPAVSRVEAALDALRASWGPLGPVLAPVAEKRPLGLYEALLRCYAERWPREKDGFAVLRNEEWVQGRFYDPSSGEPAITIDGFSYGGVLDRLIELDGKRYVMDTKTTSGYLNDAYFAKYVLSTQLRGYVALELVNGRPCEGVFVDAIHIDTRGQKAKPEHCQRWGPHRYQPWQLSEWARDTEATIRAIERLQSERGPNERWPQHDGACLSWNRLCAYYDRCSLAREVGDTLPGYREERWEPWEKAK